METKTQSAFETEILDLVDISGQITRSDLQAAVSAVVMRIASAPKQVDRPKVTSEIDNFYFEQLPKCATETEQIEALRKFVFRTIEEN